jgi:hypothetical protein
MLLWVLGAGGGVKYRAVETWDGSGSGSWCGLCVPMLDAPHQLVNSHGISRKAEKFPLRALATLENHITIATYLNQHDRPPFTLNPLGGYAPTMSSRERLLEI